MLTLLAYISLLQGEMMLYAIFLAVLYGLIVATMLALFGFAGDRRGK